MGNRYVMARKTRHDDLVRATKKKARETYLMLAEAADERARLFERLALLTPDAEMKGYRIEQAHRCEEQAQELRKLAAEAD